MKWCNQVVLYLISGRKYCTIITYLYYVMGGLIHLPSEESCWTKGNRFCVVKCKWYQTCTGWVWTDKGMLLRCTSRGGGRSATETGRGIGLEWERVKRIRVVIRRVVLLYNNWPFWTSSSCTLFLTNHRWLPVLCATICAATGFLLATVLRPTYSFCCTVAVPFLSMKLCNFFCTSTRYDSDTVPPCIVLCEDSMSSQMVRILIFTFPLFGWSYPY